MQYDLNAFYYAYSTIAQTLAGAFGFLMAVVLYQMQRLEASMEVSVKEFFRQPPCRFPRWECDREVRKMS